jgi:hypothetical protein
MMKKIVQHAFVLSLPLLMIGCGGGEKPTSEVHTDSLASDADGDTAQAVVMYNIPSPTETYITLKLSDAKYDKSLLNPADNVTKYVTNFTKAVNLGIYSADLSFALIYEQNQDVNTYLKNINQLTSELNIDGKFMQKVAQRVKENPNNLDTLAKIINEVKVNTSMYLSENKMDNTTVLVTTGGWVEAMYVLTSIADRTPKKDLINLVADQKYALKNLVKTLEQFKSDAEMAALLNDVSDIAKDYEALTPVKAAVSKPANDQVQSVGNNTSLELTKEQLKAVLKKVSALRNKLIN